MSKQELRNLKRGFQNTSVIQKNFSKTGPK